MASCPSCAAFWFCIFGYCFNGALSIRATETAAEIESAQKNARLLPLDADWAAVNKVDVKGSQRVTEAEFVRFYKEKYAANYANNAELYGTRFLPQVFNMGWQMMSLHPNLADKQTEQGLPTLGEHCFKYAGIMAGELYYDRDGIGKLTGPDRLDVADLEEELKVTPSVSQDDYAAIKKVKGDESVDECGEACGRITQGNWREFYMAKFASKLIDAKEVEGPSIGADFGQKGKSSAYWQYLDTVFGISVGVALPRGEEEAYLFWDGDKTMSSHSFLYAGLLAGEFYFDGASGFTDELGVLVA